MGGTDGVQRVTLRFGQLFGAGLNSTYHGEVRLTPTAEPVLLATGAKMLADPIVVRIAGGVGITQLVATNSEGFDTTTWQYAVTWNVRNARDEPVSVPDRLIDLPWRAEPYDYELLGLPSTEIPDYDGGVPSSLLVDELDGGVPTSTYALAGADGGTP